ncbi:MAG: hypothetical protein QGG48_10980 [Desulfatiglandales bacterium]|jgi:hypothetical protein|nr:hypothetical protein [Desulfatiglandales bacterium]
MKRYNEALETLDSRLVRKGESLRFLKEKVLVLTRIKQSEEALRVYEKV